MAMSTPKSTPARMRFEPPAPKAKVKPATTMETSERPRAMVVVNACIKTLTAFSHGEPPAASANAADARISEQEHVTSAGRSQRETNLFRRIFFIAGEFLSDDASRARIGIRRRALAGFVRMTQGKRGVRYWDCGKPPRSCSANQTLAFICQIQVCESCERVLLGCGELLRFRRDLPWRNIQRELPSTLTNGQK